MHLLGSPMDTSCVSILMSLLLSLPFLPSRAITVMECLGLLLERFLPPLQGKLSLPLPSHSTWFNEFSKSSVYHRDRDLCRHDPTEKTVLCTPKPGLSFHDTGRHSYPVKRFLTDPDKDEDGGKSLTEPKLDRQWERSVDRSVGMHRYSGGR